MEKAESQRVIFKIASGVLAAHIALIGWCCAASLVQTVPIRPPLKVQTIVVMPPQATTSSAVSSKKEQVPPALPKKKTVSEVKPAAPKTEKAKKTPKVEKSKEVKVEKAKVEKSKEVASQSSPQPKSTKWAEAKAALQRVSHQKTSDSESFLPSFTGFSAPELSYEEQLIARLQALLILPDYGEVQLVLTLAATGEVVALSAIRTESAANKRYVEETLPKVKLPPFGKQHSFEITLKN